LSEASRAVYDGTRRREGALVAQHLRGALRYLPSNDSCAPLLARPSRPFLGWKVSCWSEGRGCGCRTRGRPRLAGLGRSGGGVRRAFPDCRFNGLLGSFRRRSFFVGWICPNRFCLELLEAEEGSGDLPVEGDLIAQEEFVGANAFGGVSPRQQGAQRRVIGGRWQSYLVVEGDLLHSPNSPLTPAGGGDVFHQESLGGGARVVFLEEAFHEFDEAAGVLGFQHDGFRKESMAGTVAGGDEFSFRSDGAF
jgi:hypothetical protein